MQNIANTAVSFATGAAVGYITNSVAVSMLFKKFLGRWGGVVERYYEEFIDSVSALVENDLLKTTALKAEFSKPEFLTALSVLARRLLETEIPARAAGISFSDIPGIEQSAANLIRCLEQREAEVFRSVLNVLSKQKINLPLSTAQCRHIAAGVKELYTRKKDELLNDVTAALKMFLKGIRVKDFIHEDEARVFTKNIAAFIAEINPRDYESEIDTFTKRYAAETAAALDFSSLEEALASAPLRAFGPLPEKLLSWALSAAAAYIQEPEGRRSFERILETLYNGLKQDKTPLSALFKGQQKAAEKLLLQIDTLAAQTLPPALEEAAALLHQNSEEAERLINEAIDEELQKNKWGAVLKSLKGIFSVNFARENNIISEIENVLKNDAQKIVDDIQNKIHQFYGQETIGGCAALLEEHTILDAQKSAAYLERLLVSAGGADISLPPEILNKPLGGLINVRLSFLPSLLKNAPLVTNFVYTAGFKDAVTGCAARGIENFIQKDADAFSAAAASGCFFAAGAYFRHYENQAGGEGEKPAKNPEENLPARLLASLLAAPREDGLSRPGGSFFEYKNLWQKYKHTKIEYITNYICRRADAPGGGAAAAAVFASKIITDNLERVIPGNVSKLVNSRLSKCSPAQINTLAQNFIGKELRPINLFGALLGGITGALSAFILALVNGQNAPQAVLIPVFCAVFAGVGIGTNALAIRMLFRPYKKILFNIPPFVGAAVRRKAQFAKSIALFVQGSVLSPEHLRETFTGSIETIRKSARRHLQEPQAAPPGAPSLDAGIQKKITRFCFDALRQKAENDAERASEYLSGAAKKTAQTGALVRFAPPLAKAAALALKTASGEKQAEEIYSALKNYIYPKKDTLLKTFIPFARPFFAAMYSSAIQKFDAEKTASLLRRYNDALFDRAEKTPLFAILPRDAVPRDAVPRPAVPRPAEPPHAEPLHAAERIAAFLCGKLPAAADCFLPDILTRQARLACGRMAAKNVPSGAGQAPGIRFIERHGDAVFALLVRMLNARKYAITERILSKMHFAVRAAVGPQIPGIVDSVINRKLPLFLRQNREETGRIAEKPLAACRAFIATAGSDFLAAGGSELLAAADSGAAAAGAGFETEGGAAKAFFTALSGAALRPLLRPERDSGIHALLLSAAAGALRPYTRVSLKSALAVLGVTRVDDALAAARPFLPAFTACLQKACGSAGAGETAADALAAVFSRAAAGSKTHALFSGIPIQKIITRLAGTFRETGAAGGNSAVAGGAAGNSAAWERARGLAEKYAALILANPRCIDTDILKNDIYSFLINLTGGVWDALEKELSPVIAALLENINAGISEETKNAVLVDILLEAVLETCKNNFTELSGAVDIQAVVENEINAMHPSEIEKLFYQFAGRYFAKIIFYGWIGAAGGVLSALSLRI